MYTDFERIQKLYTHHLQNKKIIVHFFCMLCLSYLVKDLYLPRFATVSFWNKVQVVGTEKPGLSVLSVMKLPAVPDVHGTPATCGVAPCPLG